MIGARIAALRRQAGLSQAELARVLAISPSAVGMYEQGRREPSLQLVANMARILEVSTDYLITGIPRPEEKAAVENLLLGRIHAARENLALRPEPIFSQEELAVLFAALLLENP